MIIIGKLRRLLTVKLHGRTRRVSEIHDGGKAETDRSGQKSGIGTSDGNHGTIGRRSAIGQGTTQLTLHVLDESHGIAEGLVGRQEDSPGIGETLITSLLYFFPCQRL